MIFNTYDYKEIFEILHKQYFHKFLEKEKIIKTFEEVIEEFKCKNKIYTTELIVKENNLLIELILELEKSTNLNNRQITEKLKIGKNRIGALKKRLENRDWRPGP